MRYPTLGLPLVCMRLLILKEVLLIDILDSADVQINRF
jgi:hypothetical protein